MSIHPQVTRKLYIHFSVVYINVHVTTFIYSLTIELSIYTYTYHCISINNMSYSKYIFILSIASKIFISKMFSLASGPLIFVALPEASSTNTPTFRYKKYTKILTFLPSFRLTFFFSRLVLWFFRNVAYRFFYLYLSIWQHNNLLIYLRLLVFVHLRKSN